LERKRDDAMVIRDLRQEFILSMSNVISIEEKERLAEEKKRKAEAEKAAKDKDLESDRAEARALLRPVGSATKYVRKN